MSFIEEMILFFFTLLMMLTLNSRFSFGESFNAQTPNKPDTSWQKNL